MVLKERQDGVLVLTLNRPEKLNAITGELLDALYAALKEGEEDREVRALLLTGAGRAFSAGQDLTEFGDRKPDYEAHLRRYNRVVEALSGLEKPLVVAVNGVAAGAGMSLALWGDLRLAAVGASFTTAFVRIGLVPDSGLSFLLPRLVGLAKAQELLLLSPRLSAEEALALGLVHRVVPAEKLMEEALSLAKELAQGPTRAYALTKKLLLETYRLSLTEALAPRPSSRARPARPRTTRRGSGPLGRSGRPASRADDPLPPGPGPQEGGGRLRPSRRGVGFFLQAPTPFLQALEEGKEVGVHTHLLLKEEGLSLYGFPDEENLALFELLLSVSGVGPKVALALLSALPPRLLARALLEGDARLLTSASGVGRRLAERIALELKGKVPPTSSPGRRWRARPRRRR